MQDILLLGGTVLSMDPRAPRHTAVALRAGRVLAVGSADEVEAVAAPGARRVDLAGAIVLPGFHDAHVHLTDYGFALAQLDLYDAPTMEAALDLVATRARELPAGELLEGVGFSLSRWSVPAVERGSLDSVAPGRPVIIRSQDLHSAWLNSAALDLIGVSADTPDPEGGTVVRDSEGQPTGLLLERATRLIEAGSPPRSAADIRAALERAGADLAKRGITTVHHMAMDPPGYWREMATLASRPGYPVRVWACVNQEDVEHAAALGLATGQGGENFTIGGAKFFVDGALGSRTAWMLEPYADGSGTGAQVHGPEVLADRLPRVLEAALTPVIHAIGDAANRAAVAALRASRERWHELGLRPRLEHAQHMTPEDAAIVGDLGLPVSVQPAHLPFDLRPIQELLPDRAEQAYAFRSLQANGAVLALGSDAPIATPDVLAGVRAACTRMDADGRELTPNERLSVEEALAGYTRGAAYAVQREGSSGMLRAGFDADLVVLSHEPDMAAPDPQVLATIKAGAVTHSSGDVDL